MFKGQYCFPTDNFIYEAKNTGTRKMWMKERAHGLESFREIGDLGDNYIAKQFKDVILKKETASAMQKSLLWKTLDGDTSYLVKTCDFNVKQNKQTKKRALN